MFRVDFNNEVIKEVTSHLMKQFALPSITSSTFLKVSHSWITFPSLFNEHFIYIKIFPFCIIIDPEMRISQLGPRLQSLFSANSSTIGRHISDVFTLLRPDILHIEWEKVCVPHFVSSSRLYAQSFFLNFQFLKYGKSVVFIMESCIPLKIELSKMVTNSTMMEQNAIENIPLSVGVGKIRLKGQMKYIPSWHKLAFLCHPM